MRILVSAVLAVSLVSCGGEGSQQSEQSIGEAIVSSPLDIETLADPAMPDPDAASLDLLATGLTVPPQRGEVPLALPFGSNRAAAEATIASVIGPENGRSANAECGAGAMEMTSYEGLVLNFQDGKLVGYFARAPFVPLESRAEVLSGPAITMVEGSTLGEEFVIGDPAGPVISGLFEGASDDAKVEALWAGANCIFR